MFIALPINHVGSPQYFRPGVLESHFIYHNVKNRGMIIPFTELQQNREDRRRGHPQRSGPVLAGHSLAALAKEGIRQVSLDPAHSVFAVQIQHLSLGPLGA